MKKILSILAVSALFVQTASAQWTTSGNDTYYNLPGSIGVGTSSFLGKLNVAKSSTYNNEGTAGILITTGTNAQPELIMGTDNDNTVSYIQSLSRLTNYATVPLSLQPNGGNVGIGTPAPKSKLDLHQGFSGTYNETAALTFSTDNGTDNWSLGQIGGYVSAGVNNSGQGWPGGLLFKTKNADSNPNSLPSTKMALDADGNLSIGTMNPKGYKLAVNGSMIATSVQVMLYDAWPDYVFKPTYRLRPLAEVKSFIDKNQHLPGMPSAAEVQKDGLNLGEMNTLLTKKVEELTLYLIQKDKELQSVTSRLAEIEKLIKKNRIF